VNLPYPEALASTQSYNHVKQFLLSANSCNKSRPYSGVEIFGIKDSSRIFDLGVTTQREQSSLLGYNPVALYPDSIFFLLKPI
jgi:hypothetical protein